MTWYSVHLATRNPDGGDPQRALPGADDFTDQLADLDGVIAAGAGGWGATVSIDADQPRDAARHGYDAIVTAARNADLPAWPAVRLEVIDHDELALDLDRPSLPDLVSGQVAADLLGITRQRLHQLRANPWFPKPLIDQPGAILWPRAAITLFNESWERKPGRPPRGDQGGHHVEKVASLGASDITKSDTARPAPDAEEDRPVRSRS